jgi:hypothetical protein
MHAFIKCHVQRHNVMRVVYYDHTLNKLLHNDYPFTEKLVTAIPSTVTHHDVYISRLTGIDKNNIKSVNEINKPQVIGTCHDKRKFYQVEYKGRIPYNHTSRMTPGEIYNAHIPSATKYMLDNHYTIGCDLVEKTQLDSTGLRTLINNWKIMFIRKSSTGIHILINDEYKTVQTSSELSTLVNKSNCTLVVHTDTESRMNYSYTPENHKPISIDLKQLLMSWHGDMLIKKPVIDKVLYNRIFHPSDNVKNSGYIMHSDGGWDDFDLLKHCRDILKKDLMAIVLVLNTTLCGQLEDMNRPNILYLAQRMLSGACHRMNVLIEKPVNPLSEMKEKGIGAHVMNAKKGTYGKVYDMDMRAMYPSAIMDMEYDPEDVYIKVLRNGYIKPLYDFRMQLLDQISTCTDDNQKSILDTHQNICKLLMNKVTGLLNCNNKFIKADPKLYNAMTAFSRNMLKSAIDYVKDRGYNVIFADTDGLMVRAVAQEKRKKKKPKIDHEQQLSDIANDFNQQINPDNTKYSKLVFKGTWDKIFIYGDKSYDAVKGNSFICKGAFDYASTDIEKFIYKTILAYLVFEERQLCPECDTEWKTEIKRIVRSTKSGTATERIESMLLSIMTYLNECIFNDVSPWATVVKLRPDPSKKRDYEFVPSIILSGYTDKTYTHLLWDNSSFQKAVIRNRLGSGIGAFEICKQTRSCMLTKKTSKWVAALLSSQ